MTYYNYGGTGVLLYDPLPVNLATTRGALVALGFLRITTSSSVVGLTNALLSNQPHLLICDCNRGDAWLFAFIQNLRQANTVHNPFLAIILTSWDKDLDLISSAVDSGADDLLVRPFATDKLAQRIGTIVERRKSFVVSSGYVGPDRRFNRSGSTAGLLCPPNLLKSVVERSTNGGGAMLVDRDLAEARTRLHLRKLRADALRFGTYARQWQEAEAHRCGASDFLTKMRDLALSMRKRSEILKEVRLVRNCGRLLAGLTGPTDSIEKQAERLERAAGDLFILLTTGSTFENFRDEVESYLECLEATRLHQIMVEV